MRRIDFIHTILAEAKDIPVVWVPEMSRLTLRETEKEFRKLLAEAVKPK